MAWIKLHNPAYEAHRLRSRESLEQLAREYLGCSFEEAEQRNWMKETSMQFDTDIPPPAEAAAPKRGRKPGAAKPAAKPLEPATAPKPVDAAPHSGDASPAPVAAPKAAPAAKGKGKGMGKSSRAAELQAALEFVSSASNYGDNEPSRYVRLAGGMAVVANNVVAAGHPIAEQLNNSPHLDKLKGALARCGDSLVITETDTQVKIAGERLKASIICFAGDLPTVEPDAMAIQGDFEALKVAFKVCGKLASEAELKPVCASLLLEPNTCTGTDARSMVQVWHGIPSMPPGTVLPKVFTEAVAKQPGKIVGIGAAWNGEFATSFTVYFENGAWIKTQCYMDRWPNISPILDVAVEPEPTPEKLFEGLAALAALTDDEHFSVYFDADVIIARETMELPEARYTVEGMQASNTFNAKRILKLAEYMERLDYWSLDHKLAFFGKADNLPVRGVIMGLG